MPHQILRLFVLSCSVIAIAACDGQTIAPMQRAAVDTGAGSGTDGSGDTGTVDAGADTAADTAVDTEADTAADTAADTEADTAADTEADTAADTATDTATDTAGSGDTGTVPDSCPDGYSRIEPGTFSMGSPVEEVGHEADEPQHLVTITRAFCMGQREVDQGTWWDQMGSNPSRYQGLAEDPDCWPPACEPPNEPGLDFPVERVSWDDVVLYANALSRREGLAECYTGSTFVGLDCSGYRLPTEAEWEYAARGGTTTATYGDLDAVGWYNGNSLGRPHAVGRKAPNGFGLYDMLGNVREWTGDWYGNYPRTVTDPTGPAAGTYRVFRGGSWLGEALWARAADRGTEAPDGRYGNRGFRLARTTP